jgi:hypothetical protein
MAGPRRKPPGAGRDFVKGNPGGPGRPKIDPQLREAKKLTAALFQELVDKLSAMTHPDLKAYIASGRATMLELAIGGQLMAAMKGKSTPLTVLLDRTAGPVKRQVDLNVAGSISHELQDMTEEQKDALLAELEARTSGKN